MGTPSSSIVLLFSIDDSIHLTVPIPSVFSTELKWTSILDSESMKYSNLFDNEDPNISYGDCGQGKCISLSIHSFSLRVLTTM